MSCCRYRRIHYDNMRGFRRGKFGQSSEQGFLSIQHPRHKVNNRNNIRSMDTWRNIYTVPTLFILYEHKDSFLTDYQKSFIIQFENWKIQTAQRIHIFANFISFHCLVRMQFWLTNGNLNSDPKALSPEVELEFGRIPGTMFTLI